MPILDLGDAMKNPGRTFGTPEALEALPGLSAAQKQAILRQWKDQIEQLLTASAENMPGPETASGINAECLSRVVDAMARLGR